MRKTAPVVVNDFKDEDKFESDEEGEVNRIGNVPLEWYRDEDIIGYDVSGKPVEQKISLSEISKFLRAKDGDGWRDIIDVKNQRVIRLSDSDLQLIERIKSGKLGALGGDKEIDDTEFTFEWTFEDSAHPLTNKPPSKAGFIPSKIEAKKIARLVELIRSGKLVVRRQRQETEVEDIWGDAFYSPSTTSAPSLLSNARLAAPKVRPPLDSESYNPSPDLLFSEEQKAEWENAHPQDRLTNYVPKAIGCLRRVPAYSNLLREQFERCLDLYLCPRQVKFRMNVDPDSLLPKLPPLASLKPFPTAIRLRVSAPSDVTSMAVSSDGSLMSLGTASGHFQLTSLAAQPLGRSFAWFSSPAESLKQLTDAKAVAISAIAFHPNLPLLAVGRGRILFLIILREPAIELAQAKKLLLSDNTPFDEDSCPAQRKLKLAVNLLKDHGTSFDCDDTETAPPDFRKSKSSWLKFSATWTNLNAQPEPKSLKQVVPDDESHLKDQEQEDELPVMHNKDWTETCAFVRRLCKSQWIVGGWAIVHASRIDGLSFHKKGNYLAVLCSKALSVSHKCVLHSLTKGRSLSPIKKASGDAIVGIDFHPIRPVLCICYSKSIKMYNLLKQKKAPGDVEKQNLAHAFERKFTSLVKGTTFAIHPTGEAIAAGTAGGKLVWYETSTSTSPVKSLRVHKGEMLQLSFHTKLPLAVSAASNGFQLLHISSPTNELESSNIIPIKQFALSTDEGSKITTKVAWHPKRPWLFTTEYGKPYVTVWA